MSKKQFTFIKDTVAQNIKTPIVFNNEIMSIGEVLDKLNELNDENEKLKIFLRAVNEELSLANRDCDILEEENEQLKQRNDRQAKQLDRLYSLVEEKDWTALSDIIDDSKRCEEQLQREWVCYE